MGSLREGLHTSELILIAHKLFPKHEVSFWCDPQFGAGLKGYMGTDWLASDFAGNHIAMFDYGVADSDASHMVVGHPTAYPGMVICAIVRVSLKGKRS